MKAILKFDLSNEDDIFEHKRCLKSTDMYLALFDITRLKNKLKNQDISCDDIFEGIYEILENNNINLDEL
jgi:hypothetical protein